MKTGVAAVALSIAASAFAFAPGPLSAQANPGASAQQIQSACVRRGDDARVCACSVGVAAAKLDPRVFRILPDIEPLVDEQDKGKQIMGLVQLAQKNGLSVQDLQAAHDTIRANRAVVAQVCKPLAPTPAAAKK